MINEQLFPLFDKGLREFEVAEEYKRTNMSEVRESFKAWEARKKSEDLRYWYLIVFHGYTDSLTPKQATASTYMGYPTNLVTPDKLNKAKVAAGMRSDSVVTAVCFLGKGTREEFTADDTAEEIRT